MARKSYADNVNTAKVMISGIKANPDRMSKRGLGEEFLAGLTEDYNAVQQLDNEQESLKARLKEKTAELDGRMNSLKKKISEAKTTVKMEMEKKTWVEFGIQDKK